LRKFIVRGNLLQTDLNRAAKATSPLEETFFEKKAFLRAHPGGRHPPSKKL
jgi:hypothetical protein